MVWKKLTDFANSQAISGGGDKIGLREAIKKGKKGGGGVCWQIKNHQIYYSSEKLKNADIDSFELYIDIQSICIARDKNNIYYAWHRLPKVDRDSFQLVAEPYWIDKNYAYCEYETSLKPLKGMDSKSFTYLGDGYAYDKNYAYYLGRSIRSCKNPMTLENIQDNHAYAKDIENIYYCGAMLKNADIESWQLLQNGYSKDKKSIYFGQHKLPRVDLDTWEYLGESYSKDKNKVYHMAWVEENADPSDWDKKRVADIYS